MEANEEISIVDMIDSTPVTNPHEPMRTSAARPHQFFGFADNPFLDTVNPRFFFRTESHEETYFKMRQCVDEHIALGMTAARSGTGKTLLTQILLSDLEPERYRPVVILVYPQMTRTALLLEIALELEIEAGDRTKARTLLSAIHQRIIELYREGVKPVLIIDEVHFLRGDSLHVLRTLSNIEIPQRKLVTLLLFGEETFIDKLEQPQYQALLNRVFVRADLRPLDVAAVEQYVKFRCLIAGGSGSIFEPAIFPIIHDRSGGIPREVNRICFNAMARAMQTQSKSIGPDLLEDS